MPKPEKNAMALVDVCRTPIRRKIMILASELEAEGMPITAKGMSIRLEEPLSGFSYHVNQLAKAGALEVDGGAQKRGAWQKHYLPSEAFQATMTDTVALDQIAELVDGRMRVNGEDAALWLGEIAEIIRATGRPVEA